MNSWRASRPPGTGQHPPATPSLWKTSGEWDGAAAPAPPRPAALQPLPTPRGVSPLTPERYRRTISPPTAWDLPQHHHDGALAARHHHQPLPDHQSGRDDHAEVQHLVVQLGGGGGGGRGGRSGSAARSRAGQSRPDAIPRDPARPDFQPTLSPRPGSAPAACSCAAHRPESPATASPAPTAAAAPPARPRFRFRPRFFRPPPLPPAALPLPAPPPQGGGKGAAVAARAKDDAQAGTLGCFYLQYFEVNIIARHERRCGLNRYVMARECPLLSLTLRRLPGKTSPRLTYTVSKNTKSPNCSYQNTSRREGE